jgi:hypothetical protein
MNNEGHVNIWGSEKITIQFGDFLQDNYKVANHKSDEKYSSWNTDLKLYNRQITAQKLVAQDNINDYIDILRDENYIVALSSSKNSNVDKKLTDALKQIGLQIDKDQKYNNYIAAVNSNNKVFEKWGNTGINGEAPIGDNRNLKIVSSEDVAGSSSILFDNTEYSYKGNGMNIVVYDKALGSVVDSIFINSKNTIVRGE